MRLPRAVAATAVLAASLAARAGRVVARQVVHPGTGDGRCRLTLPPGRYLINAPHSSGTPRPVVLHPGETITVNFTNTCLL